MSAARLAHTYWLRFPGAERWRRWESDSEHPLHAAIEAALEYQSRMPLAVEVRRDNSGRVLVAQLTGAGTLISGADAAEGIQP